MVQLPATIDAARELRTGMQEFACDQMQKWTEKKVFREIWRDSMRNLYRYACFQHIDRLVDILTLARNGDPIADEVLCQIYRETKAAGERVPLPLSVYVDFEVSRRGEGWRFPKRRGKKKSEYMLRNIGIVHTMAALHEVYGLSPYKRSHNTISSSEIVGEILKPALGHKAVEEVWRVWCGVAPTVPGAWAA